jgi:hypothetical protein
MLSTVAMLHNTRNTLICIAFTSELNPRFLERAF